MEHQGSSSGLYKSWLAILGVLIIAGLVAVIKIFSEGHGVFNTNDVILWSLPLGGYVYLALASSGLTLLASVPLVFGLEKYQPYAKRLVFLAITTVLGAFVAIGLELGSVFNMVYVIISPNLSSPIWWVGTIYFVELVALIIKFRCIHKGDAGGLSRITGVVSFICALMAPLLIGSIFGLTESRATYFGPIMSFYCLQMAFLSGISLFLFYSLVLAGVTGKELSTTDKVMIHDVSVLFTFVLGIVILFTIVKFTIESATTIPEFLNYHRFEHAFGTLRIFHTEVIIGLFIPFVVMVLPSFGKNNNYRLISSGLVLIGILAMHMEILLAGQSRPVGPKAEQYPEFLTYFPSVYEWLVFILAIAVMLLLYTLGERYLKLDIQLSEKENY